MLELGRRSWTPHFSKNNTIQPGGQTHVITEKTCNCPQQHLSPLQDVSSIWQVRIHPPDSGVLNSNAAYDISFPKLKPGYQLGKHWCQAQINTQFGTLKLQSLIKGKGQKSICWLMVRLTCYIHKNLTKFFTSWNFARLDPGPLSNQD